MPKAVDPNKNKLDNPHIVATTFDITYTGNPPPLNATYVAIDNNSSAITRLWTVAYDYNFSPDVLEAYKPGNPGDCTAPLGSACVKALEAKDLKDFAFHGLDVSAPECEDVLGSLTDDDILFRAESIISKSSHLRVFHSNPFELLTRLVQTLQWPMGPMSRSCGILPALSSEEIRLPWTTS